LRVWIALLVFALTAQAAMAQATAGKKKLVLITQSKGFDHAVVKPREGNKPSVVEQGFIDLAAKTGMFDLEHSRDASILTPEKLKQTDIVVFYTTGILPMNPQDLADWVQAGGKFMAIHCGSDTFHDTPAYLNLVCGEFVAHPWHEGDDVTIKVLDPANPTAKPWNDAGDGLTFKEEIYQHKNFMPEKVHVILGLDMEKTKIKKPQFIPIAWCKEEGKGRVYYTSLGHRESTWQNPRYQDHLIAAIKWLNGEAEADVKPNPEISAKEDELAKKVAPPEEKKEPQKKTDKKAEAEPSKLPKLPDGFVINTFAAAPDIKSPATIAVTPDGQLFVGEDEYNTQPKRDPGLARVKLCVDSDRDGKADKFTVFADKLNSPQGMTYVGGTLYVVHAPLLTAFRDTNGDGVADSRVDLVTGLGPAPEGLVHHVPSGLRMGIDGYLYISIGDKGIEKAVGKDGRTVRLWGGGVVRVRADGTMLELFSSHTRNTFDVSLTPYLDAFTRDNTNDGDGWDSRLTQMQRDGEYGYPSLYKHWPDEIVDASAAYGGGSATGTVYVHEPGFPKTFGDCLYTTDWSRGIFYRHEMKREGAGFKPTQEEFVKDVRPVDVDVDAVGHLYLADWGRRDWGNAGPVGIIYLVGVKGASTQPARAPLIDLANATEEMLLTELASPSQIRRVEAQWQLLHRPPSANLAINLRNLAMRRGELYVRVAALFTLKQLQGDDANGMISTLASLPELREFALRGLADRDDQHYGINTQLFAQSLKDLNPRVRVQAAIGIGHLRRRELAAALVPVTADTDPLVRHSAMQSLRQLGAEDECIAALADSSRPDVQGGALRTLREFHTEKTVSAVAQLLQSNPSPALKQQAVLALTKLYHTESKWDGSWWTPRPDTRGPYYVHGPWAQTQRVADLMTALSTDRDVETAKKVLAYMGLVEMKEAVPTLARMIAAAGPVRDDAAGALIAIKASTPESLMALERVATADGFNPDVRAAAAQALAGIEPAKALPIILRLLSKLDIAPKPPQALLEKAADALASRPTTLDRINSVVPFLNAAKAQIRTAAATSLIRSGDVKMREQVNRLWKSADATRLEALLSAVPRLPAESGAPFRDPIHALLKDTRPQLRAGATIALGHLGDASSVKDLVQLASRDPDPLAAVSALAGIDPARTADDQVLVVATLLVDTSAKVQKKNPDSYGKLVSAAQKFISDPRVPGAKATTLRSKLMEPGVVYQYQRTDPIPVPAGGEKTFTTIFPPEQAAAGPFTPFSVGGKEIPWKPLLVNDPQGKQMLGMPGNSVVYLSATVDSPAAGTGYLTCSSDDGLQAWVNGAKVVSNDIDRGLVPDTDKTLVALKAGRNALLFKVNNRASDGGIQARLRTRAAEFDPNDLEEAIRPMKPSLARGRELFTTLGCVKCHTLDKHEDPKGPFLGDAGGKYDAKHLTESILRPSTKIAQGFASERILAKAPTEAAAASDYTGFVTKETADEVQLRDLTGRVTVIPKPNITKRQPQPGSMMPEGLADGLSLDDFGALLGFLKSLK
jgi:putative membrane-bound dehydrogenase-like protein